jgi:hypothetical protein
MAAAHNAIAMPHQFPVFHFERSPLSRFPLQRFNASTLQRFNASTLQRFNASTLNLHPCRDGNINAFLRHSNAVTDPLFVSAVVVIVVKLRIRIRCAPILCLLQINSPTMVPVKVGNVGSANYADFMLSAARQNARYNQTQKGASAPHLIENSIERSCRNEATFAANLPVLVGRS